MHLTVFSYPSKPDPELEPAVFQVDGRSAPERRRFERCQGPERLWHIVQDVVNRAGRLRRLDLFGHGRPGGLSLGDPGQDIVTPDEQSWRYLLELDDFLQDEAEVRLLGCETAIGDEGFRVLQGLAQGLSRKQGRRRTVWGSTATLDWVDFGPAGFMDEVATQYLRSSEEPVAVLTGTKRIGELSPQPAPGLALLQERLAPL